MRTAGYSLFLCLFETIIHLLLVLLFCCRAKEKGFCVLPVKHKQRIIIVERRDSQPIAPSQSCRCKLRWTSSEQRGRRDFIVIPISSFQFFSHYSFLLGHTIIVVQFLSFLSWRCNTHSSFNNVMLQRALANIRWPRKCSLMTLIIT